MWCTAAGASAAAPSVRNHTGPDASASRSSKAYQLITYIVKVSIKQKDNDLYQLDVSTLAPGIYMAKLGKGAALKFTKE